MLGKFSGEMISRDLPNYEKIVSHTPVKNHLYKREKREQAVLLDDTLFWTEMEGELAGTSEQRSSEQQEEGVVSRRAAACTGEAGCSSPPVPWSVMSCS